MRIRLPRRLVQIVGLIAPNAPIRPSAAGKQFKIGAERASFDHWVDFVWLAAVLSLSCGEIIDLPATGLASSGVFAAYPEQHDLSDVAEIEPDSAPIAAAVFADL